MTCAGDSIKKDVPYIERTDKASDDLFLKQFGSRLTTILKTWRPDVVIVALGSNYENAHKKLISILYLYDTQLFYVWVGLSNEMDRMRYKAIEDALDKDGQGVLIRSDDILGDGMLTTVHFYGNSAKKWANEIFNRFETVMDQRFDDEAP